MGGGDNDNGIMEGCFLMLGVQVGLDRTIMEQCLEISFSGAAGSIKTRLLKRKLDNLLASILIIIVLKSLGSVSNFFT